MALECASVCASAEGPLNVFSDDDDSEREEEVSLLRTSLLASVFRVAFFPWMLHLNCAASEMPSYLGLK